MILTNDKNIAVRARYITTTAKTDPLDYFHDEVGYNYQVRERAGRNWRRTNGKI